MSLPVTEQQHSVARLDKEVRHVTDKEIRRRGGEEAANNCSIASHEPETMSALLFRNSPSGPYSKFGPE
jgi:hypothetical protein